MPGASGVRAGAPGRVNVMSRLPFARVYGSETNVILLDMTALPIGADVARSRSYVPFFTSARWSKAVSSELFASAGFTAAGSPAFSAAESPESACLIASAFCGYFPQIFFTCPFKSLE